MALCSSSCNVSIGDGLALVKIWSGLVSVALELLVGFHLNMPTCWTIV